MISVSHKYKAIFWHIHKTGGTFIEQILTNYYDFVDSNITEVNLEELDKKFIEEKNKKEDKEKGRAFYLHEYVNHNWVLNQLEKQMYRCYNDSCGVNLELDYEDGSRNQYSIDRIDNDKAHLVDNSRLLCLNCQVTLKEFSFKLE